LHPTHLETKTTCEATGGDHPTGNPGKIWKVITVEKFCAFDGKEVKVNWSFALCAPIQQI